MRPDCNRLVTRCCVFSKVQIGQMPVSYAGALAFGLDDPTMRFLPLLLHGAFESNC